MSSPNFFDDLFNGAGRVPPSYFHEQLEEVKPLPSIGPRGDFMGKPIDPLVRRGMVDPDNVGGQMYGREAIHPLERVEVIAILEHEIEQALGHMSSFIAEDRRRSLSYYYGRPFGNEIEGRSQVVLTDVMDTVEWMLPTLLRMFLGGSKVWNFKPRRPEDIAGAKQATQYINHVFLNEMNGFQIAHDWMKTGLIEKVGFVKAYLEEKIEPKVSTYRGLTEDGLMMVLEEDKGKIEAFEEYQEEIDGEMVTMYDLRIRNMKRTANLRIDGVPPEEMLVARRTIELDEETTFLAQRKKMTVSQLISMGYPAELVASLPSEETPEYNQSRTERLSAEETYPSTSAVRADAASREMWVNECYLPIDEDGDGYTELRKITCVGDTGITILDDEEVNWMPFASICPVPMPYKFFGMSIADLVMDIQLIRSTLLRQMLDNMYLQNDQRYAVVIDEVEIDDLLTSTPGGVVRVNQPGMIEPLVTGSLGAEPFNLLEYLETVRENRTGVTRYNQGLDASSLNQTATGISSIMAASAARIEMIARIFANGGFKRLGKLLLRLMIESPVKERVVELNGEWVEVDPSTWNADMDVEVEVGLGVGMAAERISMLKMVMDLQSQLNDKGMGGLMVTPENVFNATERITEAMGFNMPELFFTDPKGQEPPPPAPDPAMEAVKQKAEEAQTNAALRNLDLAGDEKKNEAIAEFRLVELERNTMLKLRELEMKERIEMAKLAQARQIVPIKEAA